MAISVRRAECSEITSLRDEFRREMNGQIVHDSIHDRVGWTLEYLLVDTDLAIGYGSVAVAGPWHGRPTVYEFYVVPERRSTAFGLFEAFLAASRPHAYEVQSSDVLTTVLCLTFAREIGTEKVVFRDHTTTELPANGVTLRRVTPEDDILAAIAERAGGGEWVAELDGVVVGTGGILFHYNVPYGDVYMDVVESHRRRGIGAYLVQELKRHCYELGATPAARCAPSNAGSRRTLQKAGFVPYAHILFGSLDVTTNSSTL
jgi:GNAT superfamily N-acetyltransferase